MPPEGMPHRRRGGLAADGLVDDLLKSKFMTMADLIPERQNAKCKETGTMTNNQLIPQDSNLRPPRVPSQALLLAPIAAPSPS